MNKLSDAFTRGDYYEGVVCPDCLMIIVTDDDSGVGEDFDRAALDKTRTEYAFFLGWPDTDTERDEFSTKSCDGCGTTLAGDRHYMSLIKHSVL